MSLILKSVLHYTDGMIKDKSASNLYLFVHPSKLKGPYGLMPLSRVSGIIVSAEPSKANEEDESYNSMYEAVSGIPISMIFHPAYETRDFLYITKHTSQQLSKVGIVPNDYTLTVEITNVKSGLLSRKVYPKAQVHDNEE